MGIFSDLIGGISKVGTALSPLAPVVDVAGGLYNLFRDSKSQSAQQMQSLLGAAVNPRDPRFRNIAALFEEKAKEEAIRGVQEAIRAENAAYARGDKVVRGERQDEARYNTLARAFQDAGRMGNLQAMQAMTGAAGQYAPLMGYDLGQYGIKSHETEAVAGGLADLLKSYAPTAAYGGTHAFNPTYAQQQAMDADYFDENVLRGGF